MSGLLDNKTRVLDTIVTFEGKRQLAEGGINIRYVSFTDAATFYEATPQNYATDASGRLYHECSNLPHDQVTFLSDADGKLADYARDANGILRQGQFLTSSVYLTPSGGKTTSYVSLQNTEFKIKINEILKQSIANFNNLRAISTKDFLFEDDEFGISTQNLTFRVTDDSPIKKNDAVKNISHLNEIYSDPRFSRIVNFKYLPPLSKIDEPEIDRENVTAVSPWLLGNYPAWNDNRSIDIVSVLKEHSYYATVGAVKTVRFDPTSRNNNLFAQFFEISNAAAKKLDVIDFGIHDISKQQLEELAIFFPNESLPGQIVHVFFVGKIVENSEDNSSCFIHLFTLVFG